MAGLTENPEALAMFRHWQHMREVAEQAHAMIGTMADAILQSAEAELPDSPEKTAWITMISDIFTVSEIMFGGNDE